LHKYRKKGATAQRNKGPKDQGQAQSAGEEGVRVAVSLTPHTSYLIPQPDL